MFFKPVNGKSQLIREISSQKGKFAMMSNKKVFLLYGLTSIFLIGRTCPTIFAEEFELPKDLSISEHFSCYGGLEDSDAGIDWQALYDTGNNSILRKCLTGTNRMSLQNLGISDLQARLQKLKQGNLIEEFHGTYRLSFPTIVGTKRIYVQKIATEAVRKLLPTGEEMVRQIIPLLRDREEMLFHVLWSGVMDGGAAWQAAATKMKAQVKKGDTSFHNKTWLTYPRHPFHCGTNTYDVPSGTLRITWSNNMFHVVQPIFSQHNVEPIDAIKQVAKSFRKDRAVTSERTKQVLNMCGLVDLHGKPKIFTVEYNPDNLESYQLYAKLGQQFGEKLLDNIDIVQIAKTLDVTPGMAFLIVYHEICYELLQQLAEKRVLDVPGIITESADISELYRLVSLVIEYDEVVLKED